MREFTASQQLLAMLVSYYSIICTIRSILEYAVQAWQDIPEYLSSRLESIQKRALKIVHPSCNYREALVLANLDTLSSRRESLCQKFVSSMRNCPDHPLSFLCPNVEYVNVPYNLRSGHKKSRTRRFRTKRTEDFLTFKY